MRKKFPNEKLAPTLRCGEPSAENFSSNWVPWLGSAWEGGVTYMLSLAIHFGTSGQQLFPESSHLNFGDHHQHGAMIFFPL